MRGNVHCQYDGVRARGDGSEFAEQFGTGGGLGAQGPAIVGEAGAAVIKMLQTRHSAVRHFFQGVLRKCDYGGNCFGGFDERSASSFGDGACSECEAELG